MDELDKIREDIVEIKLEIKPLERLPEKLDELIKSQQEFMNIMAHKYASEKYCLERRQITDERIKKLESVVDKFTWGALGAAATVLGYIYQVTHK